MFSLKKWQVLFGRRLSKSQDDGEYTCGGGHAEFMEELAESAKRGIKGSGMSLLKRIE